jgi:hypothetical protein
MAGALTGSGPRPEEERVTMNDTAKLACREGRLGAANRLLLQEYTDKPPRRMIQIDGHKIPEGDSVMHPDEDGHCFTGGEAYELRNIGASESLPVRVQIWEGADKDEVLTLLGKITDCVERYFHDEQLRVRQVGDPDYQDENWDAAF